MAHAEAVERAWLALPPEPRAALEDLLRRAAACPGLSLPGTGGRCGWWAPGGWRREELWRDPVSPAEALWYWGFLQRSFVDGATVPVEVAFVPEDLRLYLPELPPLEVSLPEATAPPLRIAAGNDGDWGTNW
jgi:hypothetical protein